MSGCCTFVLAGRGTRSAQDVKSDIEGHGGRVVAAMSGKTTHLVLRGKMTSSSEAKRLEAKQKGVQVWTENELMSWLQSQSVHTATSPSLGAGAHTTKSIGNSDPQKEKKNAVSHKMVLGKGKMSTRIKGDDENNLTTSRSTENSKKTIIGFESQLKLHRPEDRDTKQKNQSTLWVDKYAPRSTAEMLGRAENRFNIATLSQVLASSHTSTESKKEGKSSSSGKRRAVLISGPSGTGKTMVCIHMARELGYTVAEINASQTRSKTKISHLLGPIANGQGPVSKQEKMMILVDDLDGCAGLQDTGGTSGILALVKESKVPIFITCLDAWDQRFKTLRNQCTLVPWRSPSTTEVSCHVFSILKQEGCDTNSKMKWLVEQISSECQNDVRQVVNAMQFYFSGSTTNTVHTANTASTTNPTVSLVTKMVTTLPVRHHNVGPFELTRQLFTFIPGQDSVFASKSLLFLDANHSEMMPFFVYENYVDATLQVNPSNINDPMETLCEAAEWISTGDLLANRHSGRAAQEEESGNNGLCEDDNSDESTMWEFDFQSLCCVLAPAAVVGDYASLADRRGRGAGGGGLRIGFPSLLGQISKQNKCKRLLLELRTARGGQVLDQLHLIHQAVVTPLAQGGSHALEEVCTRLKELHWGKTQLDTLIEFVSSSDITRPRYQDLPSSLKSQLTRRLRKF